MKLMVASDIHGSSYFCRQMIDSFYKEKPDKIILLGDLLYHGPRNDLPKGYDPKGVIEMLNKISGKILAVRGNCDAEVDQMVLNFPILSDSLLILISGITIFATHGHTFNTSSPPKLENGDVLLHGHTHVQSLEHTQDGYYYFNPGSVSIPKSDNKNSYMIIEDRTFSLKNLNGEFLSSITI